MSAAMVSIPLSEIESLKESIRGLTASNKDLETKIATVTIRVIQYGTKPEMRYTDTYRGRQAHEVEVTTQLITYTNLDGIMSKLKSEAFDQIQERFDGVVKENSRLQGYLADKKEDIAKLEQHVRDLENGQKKRDDEVELKKLREESFELNRSYLNEKNLREGLVKQYNQLADTLALLQEKKWYQFWK